MKHSSRRVLAGSRIRELRTTLGLTQVEASGRLGISQAKQSNMERSRRVTDPLVTHVYSCPICRDHFLVEGALLDEPAAGT